MISAGLTINISVAFVSHSVAGIRRRTCLYFLGITFFFLLGFKKLCRRWGWGWGWAPAEIYHACLWNNPLAARTCAHLRAPAPRANIPSPIGWFKGSAHTECVYIFTHGLRHVLEPTVSLALPDRHKTLFSLSRTNTHKRKCAFSMGHPVSQRALQEGASVQTFRSRRGR